jgi:hypothetical protein
MMPAVTAVANPPGHLPGGEYHMVREPMAFRINTSRDNTGGATVHPQ